MTDPKKDTAKADKEAPQDLNDAEMDKASGGWGKSGYASYSSERSASFSAASSDKNNGASS